MKRSRTSKLSLTLLSAGAIALGAMGPLAAQDRPAAAQATDLLARMDQEQGDAVWDRALELEKLGPEAATAVAQHLDAARGVAKLAGAKALLAMDDASEQDQAAAIRALKDVVRSQEAARDQRVRACDLLSRHAAATDVTASPPRARTPSGWPPATGSGASSSRRASPTSRPTS